MAFTKGVRVFVFLLAIILSLRGVALSASHVTQEEITGLWKLDSVSAGEVAKRAPHDALPEIEFRSDGRFEFVNIPKWWTNVFGQPAGKLQGIAGKWVLIVDGDRPQLSLKALGYTTVLTIDNMGEVRQIVFHVGDSNGANAVKFFRMLRKSG